MNPTARTHASTASPAAISHDAAGETEDESDVWLHADDAGGRIEAQQLPGERPPLLEIGLDRRSGVEADDLDLTEVAPEHLVQVVGLEQVDVVRVLEVGRRVRGDEERRAVLRENPGDLPRVVLRFDEVLDQVRGADVVEGVRGKGQRAAVGARRHEADARLVTTGLRCRSGVVVDADQSSLGVGEGRRTVGEPASEVEKAATGLEAIAHLPVSGGVQSQEGVGRLALDRALTGQFHGG